MRLAADQVLAPEIQAFLRGTMWSMSTSEAAVQVAPSYGENQDPDVAVQALLVTTLLPSRLRTYSLVKGQFILVNETKDEAIPSVAGSADGAPGREQIAVILAIVIRGLDRESSELGLGRGSGRNSRLCVLLASSIQRNLLVVSVTYRRRSRHGNGGNRRSKERTNND